MTFGSLAKLATEQTAEGFDPDSSLLLEAIDGAVLDLAVPAKGFTEEDRGRGAAAGDDGDIQNFCGPWYTWHIQDNISGKYFIDMTASRPTNYHNSLGRHDLNGLLRGISVGAPEPSFSREKGPFFTAPDATLPHEPDNPKSGWFVEKIRRRIAQSWTPRQKSSHRIIAKTVTAVEIDATTPTGID